MSCNKNFSELPFSDLYELINKPITYMLDSRFKKNVLI